MKIKKIVPIILAIIIIITAIIFFNKDNIERQIRIIQADKRRQEEAELAQEEQEEVELALNCNQFVKDYINDCSEVDDYDDYLYYGEEYEDDITLINLEGTSINYNENPLNLGLYPSLKYLGLGKENIDEIPDLSSAEGLKNFENLSIYTKIDGGISKVSNLETIPKDLLDDGFTINMQVCNVTEITPESKEVLQEYPRLIPLGSSGIHNMGGKEDQCNKHYMELAGLTYDEVDID